MADRVRGLAPTSTNRAAAETARVPSLRLSRRGSLSSRLMPCPRTASVCSRTRDTGGGAAGLFVACWGAVALAWLAGEIYFESQARPNGPA